jgi:pimeloyl-ACP methyl ester carboxylesterase
LECYEFTAAVEDDLKQRFTTEDKAEVYPLALRRCRDRLTLRGINLAAYTSAASASDVRDLVALLGYGQVDLYGVSYGTRLALTVMRDHPEVVHSAVLDSVEPIEEPIFNRYAASTARLLRKLFDGCAADPVCNARYPNLERVFYDLVDRLNAEPVTIWARSIGHKMYKIQLTGDMLTGGIFSAAYSSSVIPFLPRMIYDAASGDYELTEWIMGISVGSDSGISVGMMLSVNCHEEMFATTPEQIIADYEAYPNTAGSAYEAILGDPHTLFTICQEWGAAPFDPREDQPVASDIPTLILAGEYDPITPPDYGRQVAEQLSRSYFYEYPGQGHGVSLWASSCAYRMARDFLDDPLSEPDASCIAAMAGPEFIE